MNLPRTLFVIATMAWSSASAALYTLNNGSGSLAAGIQTRDGSTFRAGTTAGTAFPLGGGFSAGPGVVAFGSFSTDDLSGVTSITHLLSLFDQFGNSVAFNFAGPTGARSVFSSAQIGTLGAGGAEESNAGDFIYLFVGNGTTLLNSSDFLVVKSSFIFDPSQDVNPLPNVLTISPANSQVLYGSVVANVQTANVDNSVTPGWQLGIPEPSAALLGLLGAIGLLRRRR